jgi:hypothetical protein
MANHTVVTCSCYLEVSESSEYEAQTEVEKIMEKGHILSNNIILKIAEIQHITTYGCGVNYNNINNTKNEQKSAK